MQQPSTRHGDHQPDALDWLAGFLSCEDVSGKLILTAGAHDNDDDDTTTLTRLAEGLPDLFAREVLQRIDTMTRGMLAETSKTFRTAVASSGLPRVRKHRSERLELKEFCNSIERLAWAKSRGCFWNERTCAVVAEGGHLEVLAWAREHGCPWNEWTCASAAWGGHLEVLAWAREHGCPWDELTCAHAAWEAHLEVLVWVRAHGCPWDGFTMTAAIRAAMRRIQNGKEVLEYVTANNCPSRIYAPDIDDSDPASEDDF